MTDRSDEERRAALAAVLERARLAYFDPAPKKGPMPEEPPDYQPKKPKRPARGIPTMYAGVQFRSRVEARWAAFFDLCGWEWDYEPFDLDGYIPDFLLKFYKPLLVEVKHAPSLEALTLHTSKIEASGWAGESMLVGAGTMTPREHSGHALGILDDKLWSTGRNWGDAIFLRCSSCKQLSVFHSWQSYACRVCGVNDHHIEPADPVPLWRDACNRVQWKPPQVTP